MAADAVIEQHEAVPADPQTALYAALAHAQEQATNIQRNAMAIIGPRQYKYATLDTLRDAIRPIMAAHGLALVGRMAAGGILWHLSHVGGGTLEWQTAYPDGAQSPHGLGSAVTYLTRYQLALVMGIASEDDDDAHIAQAEAAQAEAAQKPARARAAAPAKAEAAPSGDKEATMNGFWAAWRKADLPVWKTDRAAAQAACDALILRVLGTKTYFRDLTEAQVRQLTAALEPAEPPSSDDDPFGDLLA